MNGRLVAICISERKGTPKRAAPGGRLIEEHGLAGDAHAGPGHRQISLLDAADIDAARARGLTELQPGAFGENLIVAGLTLAKLGLGSRLSIGPAAELELTQRGKLCHHRCAIYYRTGDCIMTRQGVFARVLRGGPIEVGDPVEATRIVAPEQCQCTVLTISDKASRAERVDTAGPAVVERLRCALGAHIYETEILPDERPLIAERLRHYADGPGVDLIVAVGGTGFAPRDVTPEAVRDVVERLTPGLDEAMRAASLQRTPRAMLSRAVSGIRKRTLIVSLPGSEVAAIENLDAILPALPHAVEKLRGGGDDCGVAPSPAAAAAGAGRA